MIRLLLLILVLLAKTPAHGQTSNPTDEDDNWHPVCEDSDTGDLPAHHEEAIGTLTFTTDYIAERLEDHVKYPKSLVKSYGTCQFKVTTPSGAVIVSGGGDPDIMPLEHADVDGDGAPELIIRTEAGGSAGCATLHFVQVAPPKLLKTISACEGISVEDVNHDGRTVIVAHDGFYLSDTNCHACQPNVPVYLRFEDGKLRDVSSEYQAQYDQVIAELRAKLRPKYIEALLSARNEREIQFLRGFNMASEADAAKEPYEELASDAHNYVLRIVVYYLFSGREQQAWQALDEMWPAWDRERVKADILKTLDEPRSEDVLKYVAR